MNRIAILLTALAFSVSACGADDASQADVAAEAAKPTIEQARAESSARTDKLSTVSAAKLAKAAEKAAANAPEAMTREEAAEQLVAAADSVASTAANAAADVAAKAEGMIDTAGAAARVAAGDRAYQAGKHYTVLSPAQRTSSPPEKVEIAEVFMYQCPHCFSFEPFVKDMIDDAPPQVNIVRLPAVFNNVAELHAKAFYAAQSMGVWEELHTPFFREIHTRRNLMPSEDKLLTFIASQGIDSDKFAAAMKSFDVDSKVRDARDLNARYRIASVPTVVINGKYVTSASQVGSTDTLKNVIDYLVAKETLEL